MKTLFFLAFALFSTQVFAESIQVGCAVMTYDCDSHYKPGKCSWGSDVGRVLPVDIKQTGTGPSFQIWEGGFDGVTKKIPFHLSIYQRREGSQNFNYLTVTMKVNGLAVSSKGQNVTEARYLDEGNKTGIGIHCTSDFAPTN